MDDVVVVSRQQATKHDYGRCLCSWLVHITYIGAMAD